MGGPFLDWYHLSGLKGNVQGSDGSCDVKRDFVKGSNDGKIVGSNFVGGVSIGAYTICSNDAGVDFLGLRVANNCQ